MKNRNIFGVVLFTLSIIVLIMFISGMTLKKEKIEQEHSKFDQAYQKVQHFDSLSEVYTQKEDLQMMIDCRDSMVYYLGEMIRNFNE